jgi:TPR repeat protein
VKKLVALLACLCALSAHALGFQRCSELGPLLGVPDGHLMSPFELQALERAMRAENEFAWPSVLGTLHVCGVGVAKDVDKGLKILKDAAAKGGEIPGMILIAIESGYLDKPVENSAPVQRISPSEAEQMPQVQYELGALSAMGGSVPRNPAMAERWWLKAASQGYEDAQLALGALYFDLHKYKEALPWLNLSAAQGKVVPRFLLGQMYFYGLGVTADEPTARRWTEMAAQRQYRPAKAALAEWSQKSRAQMLQERGEKDHASQLRLAGGATPELKYSIPPVYRGLDIEVRSEADTLKDETRAGNPDATFKLGVARWYGRIGEQDEREGLRLIRLAASRNHADAVFWLARAYHQGSGLPSNLVAAYALYFHSEFVQSQGIVQLASFAPPFDEPLNEKDLRRAQQLAQALAVPGQFLLALDSAVVAGDGR